MRPIAFGFKKVQKSDSLFLAIGTFMHSLDRGIHRFDAAHLTESSKDIFAGEGRGETRVLIITCSDIGIDPFTLFGDKLVKLAVLQRAGKYRGTVRCGGADIIGRDSSCAVSWVAGPSLPCGHGGSPPDERAPRSSAATSLSAAKTRTKDRRHGPQRRIL